MTCTGAVVLHLHQVCISIHCRDNGPQDIGVMTLTFMGHVTSSVTWPMKVKVMTPISWAHYLDNGWRYRLGANGAPV